MVPRQVTSTVQEMTTHHVTVQKPVEQIVTRMVDGKVHYLLCFIDHPWSNILNFGQPIQEKVTHMVNEVMAQQVPVTRQVVRTIMEPQTVIRTILVPRESLTGNASKTGSQVPCY